MHNFDRRPLGLFLLENATYRIHFGFRLRENHCSDPKIGSCYDLEMKNTSPWVRRFAAIAIASAGILIGSSIIPFHSASQVMASRKLNTVEYSLMPGQSMDFRNRKYHRVEVRSTFPIRVLTGPCHEEYVVQFSCDSAPGDVFITDRRSKPLFGTPQGNQVTITEIKK
jgi:hypothetical protein